MPPHSHWTQTQQRKLWLCLRTTEKWGWCRRSCCTRTIRRGSATGIRCCVKKAWLGDVTGKWTGRAGWILEWRTRESKGKGETTTAGSVRTMCPGVWCATINSQPATKTKGMSFPCSRPWAPAGWRCIWTGLGALCLSTQSHPTHWFPSTPSTPRLPNLFILRLGLSRAPSHRFVCVELNGKKMSACTYRELIINKHQLWFFSYLNILLWVALNVFALVSMKS